MQRRMKPARIRKGTGAILSPVERPEPCDERRRRRHQRLRAADRLRRQRALAVEDERRALELERNAVLEAGCLARAEDLLDRDRGEELAEEHLVDAVVDLELEVLRELLRLELDDPVRGQLRLDPVEDAERPERARRELEPAEARELEVEPQDDVVGVVVRRRRVPLRVGARPLDPAGVLVERPVEAGERPAEARVGELVVACAEERCVAVDRRMRVVAEPVLAGPGVEEAGGRDRAGAEEGADPHGERTEGRARERAEQPAAVARDQDAEKGAGDSKSDRSEHECDAEAGRALHLVGGLRDERVVVGGLDGHAGGASPTGSSLSSSGPTAATVLSRYSPSSSVIVPSEARTTASTQSSR